MPPKLKPGRISHGSSQPSTFPPLQNPSSIPVMGSAADSGGRDGATPSLQDAYIADDPLKLLLGDKGVGYVGEREDTLPDELIEFLTVNDMGGRRFQVVLKQVSEGAADGTSPASYVKSWWRAVPSIEHIARNYGPGRYVFHISYQAQDPETGKPRQQVERIYFEVSDKYEQEYLEFQREQKLVMAKKRQEKIREMRNDRVLDSALLDVPGTDGSDQDSRANVKQYIEEITEVAGRLGLTRVNESKGLLEQLAPVMPLLVPIIQGLIENGSKQAALQQQQYNSMLAMMLGQAEKNNQQLLEVIKTTQGQGSGSSAVKEFKDMVMGAIDLKEALKGHGEESVMDRVFGVIETVLPQVLSIAAMNKAQQAVDPRVALARAFVNTSPDFRAVMNDPAKMVEMVTRLDAHYGYEQTDMILTVAGLQRPAECPRVQAGPADEGRDGVIPSMQQEGATDEPGDAT